MRAQLPGFEINRVDTSGDGSQPRRVEVLRLGL
ncbi:hypothetical protein HNQ51_002761 [Inhella inkyongensis]|uniref:Uncharacterized protein n=1 Tax=Inhella inkyongensis TaxID=392593 RepID=A0A840S756_9BURK|nr:hypothetical protein [Inhella inkyongensis]